MQVKEDIAGVKMMCARKKGFFRTKPVILSLDFIGTIASAA
jgi:hypothetical protein